MTDLLNKNEVGKTQIERAIQFAARETKEMSAAITVVMEAKEDWEGGPFAVLWTLKAAYGSDLVSWPIVGSETGNNPDKIEVVKIRNGKEVKSKTTFYKQFALNTKEGQQYSQALRWIAKQRDPEANKDGMPADIGAMDDEALIVHEGFCTRRLNTISGSYQKAMKLGQKFHAIENLKHVTAEPILNGNGKLVNSDKNVMVAEHPFTSTSKRKPITQSQFMRLNVEQAVENGGTLAALLKTLERDSEGEQGGESGAKPELIRTLDKMDARINDVCEFIDYMASEKDMATYGLLLKKLQGAGSDDLLRNVGTLRDWTTRILRQDKLASRLEAMEQADADKAA